MPPDMRFLKASPSICYTYFYRSIIIILIMLVLNALLAAYEMALASVSRTKLSILAQEKNITSFLPYFYICLVVGMLASKLSTQKAIDAGTHRLLVYSSLVVLIVTMVSFLFLETGAHLLIAGFFFGLGYGILQPLFQSFVTGTTPGPQRGVANLTYMLSYDIGIGIGSLLMGFMQESIGLTTGFAFTALAYLIGGVVYLFYADGYYRRLKGNTDTASQRS